MSVANDNAILAILSQYPNMDVEDANLYIGKIEDDRYAMVAKVIVGQIDISELDEQAGYIYSEIKFWYTRKQEQIQAEQRTARRRGQKTPLAKKMLAAYEQGRIPIEMLMLYGISGDLPQLETYSDMNQEEREVYWRSRISGRVKSRTLTERMMRIIVTQSSEHKDWRSLGL